MDISSVDYSGMDIAGASMSMKAMEAALAMEVAVLDKTMDAQTAIADQLIQSLMVPAGKVDMEL